VLALFVADTQLFDRLSPSVDLLVRWSVGLSARVFCVGICIRNQSFFINFRGYLEKIHVNLQGIKSFLIETENHIMFEPKLTGANMTL